MITDDVNQKIDKLEHEYRPYSISEEFHDKTRLREGGKARPYSEWPPSWIEIDFKGYPRLQSISLGEVSNHIMNSSLGAALQGRVSTRAYDATKPLTTELLSTLLFYSAGIKSKAGNDWNTSRRFYPSGGARYVLEVYPVIFGPSELKKGVYHYNVKKHALEVLKLGNYLPQIKRTLEPTWIKDASMILFVTAVFGRNQVKYGDRGYRHILVENGHMAQNVYLNATALGLGCSALGGYADDRINNLLDVDGVNESVINTLVVGFPR